MRILATFCAAFAAGILAAQYALPLWLLPYAALGCAALGLAWSKTLHEHNRLRALLIGYGLAAALVWNCGYVRLIQAPFEALAGETRTLTVEAVDYPSATDYGWRVEVRILGRGLHGKAIYYGDAAISAAEPGTRLTAPVSVSSAASIRGAAVSTHVARGVYLLLYQRGSVTVEPGRAGSARYFPQRLARRMEAVIAECFPERTRAFMNALLLGDKFDLSAEDKTHLSEAGLFHITAVSGLHCAFLFAIIGNAIGWHRAKTICVIAIPLLTVYAVMVGLTPSVVRAYIMLTVVMFGGVIDREPDLPTSLFLALFLVLLKNPFAIKSVSLQLSFAALAGIVAFTVPMNERMLDRRIGRLGWFFYGPLAATAGALLFTVPLNAIYFGNLSLIAALSNFLCLWTASVTFALGALTALLGMVWLSAAQIVAVLPHVGATALLTAAKLLTEIPCHAVYFANPFLKLWLVYVYAMLAVCVLLRGRFRWAIAGTLAVLTLALALWLNVRPMADGALHILTLDVGQGQSVAFHAGGETALLDCGSSSYLDAGDAAADELQACGVNTLDYLVVSHYHDDHCNGLPTLLARLTVKRLLLPDIEPDDPLRIETLALAEHYGIPVTFVREDAAFPLGGATLTVYAPLGDAEMNEECLTALCSVGDFDALFTADIDANTEYRLIATHDLPDVEVLMAGHHGSRYSTGEDLLAEVTPETAVISCGADNGYGHPHVEVLRRLTAAGAAIYRTDRQGCIHITVNTED